MWRSRDELEGGSKETPKGGAREEKRESTHSRVDHSGERRKGGGVGVLGGDRQSDEGENLQGGRGGFEEEGVRIRALL